MATDAKPRVPNVPPRTLDSAVASGSACEPHATAADDAAGPDATARRRIVVFTGSLAYSVRQGVAAIDDCVSGLEWLIVHVVPRKRVGRVIVNQWKNLRRNGWRWMTYQLGEARQQLRQRLHPAAAATCIGREYSVEGLASRPNIRIERVDDIHHPQALELVRTFGPELGLSLAAPILERSLFGLPRLGTLNLHKGKLPEFRGMPPAFWELWHDRWEVGCSVHRVDDRLDTGPLLGQLSVRRMPHSTVRGLQIELDDAAIGLTADVVCRVLDGTAQPVDQATDGAATFRKPTLRQQAQLRARLEPRKVGMARVRQASKDLLAGAMVGACGLGVSRLMRPRVTVILYHRVTDDVRDNLTVGIEQFDRRLAWLAANCQVLGIDEVLAMHVVPRTDRPLVAITFDDGYLDNYRYAAPLLRRHGLPAAFFVSTGIVGSDLPFPHDEVRGNPPIDKMNWDQLREMRRWGFDIGSHTVNHVDCAIASEAVVWRELTESRDRLRSELDLHDVVFAYPYGGRHHMTAQRLEMVKQAGFAGCLSAYGGTNVEHVDRFNLLRCSDSQQFSEPCFRRMVLGLP